MNYSPDRVYTETRYDRFHYIVGNREVSEPHIKEVMNKLQDIGYRNIPITVNGKMEIVEGQHRFEACKRLGLPIRFVVDENAGLDECMKVNSVSKNWKNIDYINAYAEKGDINYKWLGVLVQKYPCFDLNTIQEAASSNSSRRASTLRDGTFEFSGDCNQADRKLSYMKKFNELFEKGKLEGRKQLFYRVVSFCYDRPEIDNNRLLEQVCKYFDRFSNISNIRAALQGMDEVYNYYKKSGKVNIERLYDENIGPARGRKKARNLS